MRAAEIKMTEVAVIEGSFGGVFVYMITGADVSTQIDANLSPGCLLLWSGKIFKCTNLVLYARKFTIIVNKHNEAMHIQ